MGAVAIFALSSAFPIASWTTCRSTNGNGTATPGPPGWARKSAIACSGDRRPLRSTHLSSPFTGSILPHGHWRTWNPAASTGFRNT